MYPYWCVEKGYARFVGPRDGPAEWIARARGWIRVMHLDIACSLVIYTMATVAFYLLGAGVLHRMGVVPAARDTVAVLSQHLHPDARRLGAVAVLLRRRRHAVRDDLRRDRGAFADDGGPRARRSASTRATMPAARLHWRNRFVVVLGDCAGDLLLVLRVAGPDGRRRRRRAGADAAPARCCRDLRAPHAAAARLQPSLATTAALWISTAVMLGFALYYLWSACSRA